MRELLLTGIVLWISGAGVLLIREFVCMWREGGQ